MSHPIIGWEKTESAPNVQFNSYLHARNGRLFYEELDLASLFLDKQEIVDSAADEAGTTFSTPLATPLEFVYLPTIERKIFELSAAFDRAIDQLNYGGQFHFAYASKANAAEEIIRATLQAGAHHEMSSQVDVLIAHAMIERGLLTPDRMILSNGFKPTGSGYAHSLLDLKRAHDNLIPIVESLDELEPLLNSAQSFDVGLRHKSYGKHDSIASMDSATSRFGLNTTDLTEAARIIRDAPNLHLKMFHGMIGSQLTDADGFVDGLRPSLEVYAQLRADHPELSIFNFGGGMPIGMTLDFDFDYDYFATKLLAAIQELCAEQSVHVPDVMGEFGRYTTAEQGAHFFKVTAVKESGYDLPWYIIDGSIMSSFPDSWALGEHFIVLPLNHLDKPFQQVRLGGITCDSDDQYPPKPSQSPLYLPAIKEGETDELYVGFFAIGAYQEMLGGVRGSKHCVLPEAAELIVDRDDAGHTFELIPGQTTDEVLRNLGYIRA